jgi:hypothetical protein
MAADGESTGKSKGGAGRPDGADIDEFVEKAERLDVNELETIPTMVPREGCLYRGKIPHSRRHYKASFIAEHPVNPYLSGTLSVCSIGIELADSHR